VGFTAKRGLPRTRQQQRQWKIAVLAVIVFVWSSVVLGWGRGAT
jgi:hypothetical protein